MKTNKHNLVQLTKKSVLLLLMLATGLVAHATIQSNIRMQGKTQNNHYIFVIESIWGENCLTGEGSSYTFSNTTIADITLDGTLNFQQGTDLTDVITGSSFTVTITKNNQWFYGATVQTQSGDEVTECTVTTSNNHNTLTVTIPQGMTFGSILVDYVVKEPFNSSNTVITGIASDYIYTGSPIVPVPTVTYNGALLTEGTDYTVSYSNNAVYPNQYTITGYVIVTGMGDYAGSVVQSFTYHNVKLSDFTQLSDGSYQIATQQDLDYLALLVNGTGNDCQGLTFKQTADIAYTYTTSWNSSGSETNFTAIGGWGKTFKGTFDGQNHSISGIRITKTGQSDTDKCQGLFGYVGTGGTVRNVVLADTRIKGYTGTGGIVGVNEGTIEDCRVQSNVLFKSSGDGSNISAEDNGSDFGGIAGSNNNGGTVTRCTSSATINGKIGSYQQGTSIIYTFSENLGGIVGNNRGTVSNCLALNAVVTGKNYAAAIVGNNNIGNNAGSLTANYYRSCTVTNKTHSNGSSIDVGVGDRTSSLDQDGARSVHALTLGTDITATGESVEIDGTTYYASNTTVTLGYSGTVPAGQMLVYSVNGTTIEGNTFNMRANDNTTVRVTMIPVLEINGYGNNTTGGWYLIASPVSTTPSEVENMLTDETEAPYSYDLYRFNQSATAEWENYHLHASDFNIIPGQGYLYANSQDVTLTFVGAPYQDYGEVTLVKDDDATFSGWNLVGNPFTDTAYIDRPFYIMNDAGSEIIAAGNRNYIKPMEGIFVQADEDGETLTFTTNAPSKGRGQSLEPEQIVINLSTLNSQLSTSIIDRAIVRFDGGRQLPKLQIFKNSPKLYIPQGGKDYAIISSDGQSEMPLNFKAKENGEYTLTISESLNSKFLILNYLHLIDNIAGQDIDLLTTPNYTFTARNDDYASRFKLVFDANDNDNQNENEDFAFISNGEIIVNGEGTLQVIDALGRILFTQDLSPLTSHLSPLIYKPGVYVLRLISGENVKTQKIVIR